MIDIINKEENNGFNFEDIYILKKRLIYKKNIKNDENNNIYIIIVI